MRESEGEGRNFTLMQRTPVCLLVVMDSEILNMEPAAPNCRCFLTPIMAAECSWPSTEMMAPPQSLCGHRPSGTCAPQFWRQTSATMRKRRPDAIFATLKGGKHVVWANTLEELADQMDIPRRTPLETVARYNQLCAKGHDDDFLKPATHMIPIQSGPFYAIHNHLAHDGIFRRIRR